MKFVIATQELNFLINKCLNVVAAKPPVPLLANFLIEAKNNELVITATDLIVGIKCFTEAKVLEEGAASIPSKRLYQLIRELTAANVEITISDNHIAEIVADCSRFKLNGMSSKEFPSLPDMGGATRFTIAQSILKDLFSCTSFAVSREDNRHVLTGVNIQIANGRIFFVGTDGKRLSRSYVDIELDPAFSGNFVIPLKGVEEIKKNLGDEGDAIVSLMKDKIAIDASNTMLITKLLSGDYPDVSRIIPEKTDVTVSLHRDELMTLLRQVSLFTEGNQHSVRFSFGDGELHLAANTMNVGEGKVSMPVNYHGAKLDIAFNPNYFLDVLRHSKEEAVTIGLTDSFNPGIIVDKNGLTQVSQDLSPLFVLMPMRLNV